MAVDDLDGESGDGARWIAAMNECSAASVPIQMPPTRTSGNRSPRMPTRCQRIRVETCVGRPARRLPTSFASCAELEANQTFARLQVKRRNAANHSGVAIPRSGFFHPVRRTVHPDVGKDDSLSKN